MASINSVSEPTMPEDYDVCRLCLKSTARYTCPRCNVRYCCAQCYKCVAHAQCSEAFYRDCFMEGLQDIKTSSEDKKKVLDVLKRLEEDNPVLSFDDDDVDDDDQPDLAERLQGMDLDKDSDKIWGQLTDNEKKDFNCQLRDGRLGYMIEVWQPWWTAKLEMVEEVNEAGNSLPQYPHILRSVPEFSKLMPNRCASETLRFNIVNVLFAYAYIMRLHNGDINDDPVQSASEILQLSDALQEGKHSNTKSAVYSMLQSLHSASYSLFVAQEFSIAVLQDLQFILSGPGQRNPLLFIMSALSHLCRLLKAAKKCSARDSLPKAPSNTCSSQVQANLQDKKIFHAVQKKVEFYLSWTQTFGLSLQCLIVELELEFCVLSTEISSHKHEKERLEQAWGGKQPPKIKCLVEEIE